MFEKVNPTVDFVKLEHEMLKFWQENQTFEKLRKQNAGKPKWSFLDGPITANNPMGVHHAWGRTYKDAYQRYFAMNGRELRYQNGFDCQGLWVEVEVEKELGFKSKKDIESYGIEKFVEKCKERVRKFSGIQTQQSIRLAYWMDWSNSYYTMSDVNNYAIWGFLKKCHERSLIYKGYDSMPWCPRCAVGISQMEMHEGYHLVADTAVFVRFPLRKQKGEYLLVWTTTPWTLSSNVAAAVNPQLTYLKLKFKDEFYYLSEGALTAHRLEEDFKKGEWVKDVPKLKSMEQIFKEMGGFEIVEKLSGQDMIGWAYDGPFDELPAQNKVGGYPKSIANVVMNAGWSKHVTPHKAHRVVPWSAVGEAEGTGIVHIAPGCGKEDFELGKTQELPMVAPLDEMGVFLEGFDYLTGKAAADPSTAQAIVEDLKKRGILVATEKYPHRYPHCWRCHSALLFRLVDEWYIDMKWRDEIKENVKKIHWIPEWGEEREQDWLSNMGNWMISKKRYWGLALPIFECECGWFDVVGSQEELKRRCVEGWNDFDGHSPHRPWVDKVKIKCEKCGKPVSRVLDVGNPWLDAGIVPYSTVKYYEDREYWKKWIPADLVTECFPGQFRNWFYALLSMSTMMENIPPFKTLLGHALVRDEKGQEMHKSLGNAIWFDDAAEKMGVDVMRWIFCRQNPLNNVNFGYNVGDNVRSKVFNTWWNVYSFFSNYARLDGFDPLQQKSVSIKEREDIDQWLLAKLQKLIVSARESFEKYDVASYILRAEEFMEDLSNWYVRRCRRRFWRPKNEKDANKAAAYQTLYETLVTLCKLLAPITPFLSEVMYQNLVRANDPNAMESVHLSEYPKVNPDWENKDIAEAMDAVASVVKIALGLRKSKEIRVRQPLAEIRVASKSQFTRESLQKFEDHLLDELNIKKLSTVESFENLLSYQVKPNFKTIRAKVDRNAMKDVTTAISQANPDELAKKLKAGEKVKMAGIELTAEEFLIEEITDSNWVSTQIGDMTVALNIQITPELKSEGLARDIVRHVQQMRKDRDLEIENQIRLWIFTEDKELQSVVQKYGDYIKAETLSTEILTTKGEKSESVEIEKKNLFLDLMVNK